MTEPKWLTAARAYIGTAEIPGKETSPVIRKWLIKLNAWWADDETPWCGAFVGAVMAEVGIERPKHWYRAKGWLEWGVPSPLPSLGCIVVFDRAGGGHVGFVIGVDRLGRLMVLGGNQGNRVSVVPFERSRVLGYRVPKGQPLAQLAVLPVVENSAAASRNEA
jgi:uncharacterized protein (TIGR02594 family)